MPESVSSTVSDQAISDLSSDRQRLNRGEWLGVITVFSVAVAPDMFYSYLSWHASGEINMTLPQIMWSIIIRSAKVSVVIWGVMVLLKTPWESIGFQFFRFTDLIWAIGIWLAGSIAANVAIVGLLFLGYEVNEVFDLAEPGNPRNDFVLLAIGSFANGFAEETVIRGYLLTRFEKLLGSTSAAVIISTLMFAAYHLYQGVVPMAGIFALGLVYATAFCYLRRIWPLIVAHAIADFTGFLLL